MRNPSAAAVVRFLCVRVSRPCSLGARAFSAFCPMSPVERQHICTQSIWEHRVQECTEPHTAPLHCTSPHSFFPYLTPALQGSCSPSGARRDAPITAAAGQSKSTPRLSRRAARVRCGVSFVCVCWREGRGGGQEIAVGARRLLLTFLKYCHLNSPLSRSVNTGYLQPHRQSQRRRRRRAKEKAGHKFIHQFINICLKAIKC